MSVTISESGVTFATNAQAQGSGSSSTVVSPAALEYAITSPNLFRISAIVLSSATSGTGAGSQVNVGGYRTIAPTSATGHGMAGFAPAFHNRNVIGQSSSFDWSKRFIGQFRYQPRTLGTDSNTVNRVCWGKAGLPITGDLANRGVGIKQAASGALVLQAHDGTTLTSVTSSLTPTVNTTYDIRIVSDGAGNVTLFSNDSQIATTSAGPTTASGSNAYWITVESENLATITGTANSHLAAEITSEFAI